MCPESKGDQPLISGKCAVHYWAHLRAGSVKRHLVRKKVLIPNLKDWYNYQIDRSTWVCDNCGELIDHFSEEARHAAQAHILPKHLFRSVATHPLNRLHLGNGWGCDCHSKYDHSFKTAQQMPVMAWALVLFQQFAEEIAPGELRHLPTIFQETLNNCNYGRI